MFGEGGTESSQVLTSARDLLDLKLATTRNDICSTIVPYE